MQRPRACSAEPPTATGGVEYLSSHSAVFHHHLRRQFDVIVGVDNNSTAITTTSTQSAHIVRLQMGAQRTTICIDREILAQLPSAVVVAAAVTGISDQLYIVVQHPGWYAELVELKVLGQTVMLQAVVGLGCVPMAQCAIRKVGIVTGCVEFQAGRVVGT